VSSQPAVFRRRAWLGALAPKGAPHPNHDKENPAPGAGERKEPEAHRVARAAIRLGKEQRPLQFHQVEFAAAAEPAPTRGLCSGFRLRNPPLISGAEEKK